MVERDLSANENQAQLLSRKYKPSPSCPPPSPCSMLQEDKRRKEGKALRVKLHTLNCVRYSLLSRCPQGRIPSGAAAARRLHGHLWSWKHDLLLLEKKLPAGGRAAGRSGASHRDGAGRSHFPTHNSLFLQSLSWPLSQLGFLFLPFPSRSL